MFPRESLQPCPRPFTSPWRRSRQDKGEAHSRAGGGKEKAPTPDWHWKEQNPDACIDVLEAGCQALVGPPPHQPSPGGSASAPPSAGSDVGLVAIIVLHATVGASLVGAQSGNHRATTTRATTRVAPTLGRYGVNHVWLAHWHRPGGAGGTPALPGSLHPMTSSDQRDKVAEAFGRRLSLQSLQGVHLSSGLFVFIRVHSWFVFIDDQPFFLE